MRSAAEISRCPSACCRFAERSDGRPPGLPSSFMHHARVPFTVRTTLPVFCQLSTYLDASAPPRAGTCDRRRPVTTRLHQLLEEDDVLCGRAPPDREHDLLLAARRQEREWDVDQAGRWRRTPRLARGAAANAGRNACRRRRGRRRTLAAPREVLLLVVDDLVGAERAHELDVLPVAHGGHMGAEVPCELDGCGAAGALTRRRRGDSVPPRGPPGSSTPGFEPSQTAAASSNVTRPACARPGRSRGRRRTPHARHRPVVTRRTHGPRPRTR